MATHQILYWKDVPAQVRVFEGKKRISRPMPDRFQTEIDRIAMKEGLAGSDEYLDSWSWGSYNNISGTAKEAALSAAEHFNRQFPLDFVARIKKLHGSDIRDPTPGAIDHWCAYGKS